MLLLDVVGNEEPVRVTTTVRKSSNQTTRPAITSTIKPDDPHPNIKFEEFDVDEFLSNDIDEATCPSSPESQSSSPSSSENDSDLDEILKLCTNNGMVGETTYDGYGIDDKFMGDEFLLSCATELPNTPCAITSMNDPFSELFPSLLSV